MFGPGEWIAIVVVVLILFGPKKLPDLARSVGEAMREFKKSAREAVADDNAPPVETPRRLEVTEHPADASTHVTS